MNRKLLVVSFVGALAAVSQRAPVAADTHAELVIRNISVLEVQSAAWLRARDIIVRGTQIAEVRAAGAPLPPAKVTINGEGKFAIPGLFDNRVHLSGFAANDAGVFVAHGVTSVWDIGTDPRRIADWRQDIGYGKFMGPRIVRSDATMPTGIALPASGASSRALGGPALHDALARMVSSGGMTPAAALASATIDSAAFHGRSHELGSIERGKIADLIVLTGDPLSDIAQTRNIDAVVFRGETLTRAHLNRLLTPPSRR